MIGSDDLARLSPREAAAFRALMAVSRLGDGPVLDFDQDWLHEFLDAIGEHRQELERDVALILGTALAGEGIGVDLVRIEEVMEGLETALDHIANPQGQWLNPTKPSMRAALDIFVRTWLYVMRHDAQEQKGLTAFAHPKIRVETRHAVIDATFTVVETGTPAALR